ncbi:MAG: NAD-dependent epimerase [Coxiellaceae bacterium]|nr:NAD-dependent epimerase [Coxiellaceae bacterium]
MKNNVVLVTGAAGFIGFHLSNALLERGNIVIGIDNLNDYYDVNLKLARLEKLKLFSSFTFYQCDLVDKNSLVDIFKKNAISGVVNLAAQAGVRYSIDHPDIYVQSNVVGFLNILECCRHYHVEHLVYASTSSVYGAHTNQPFSEHDHVDHPMTLYAATKKSNELMAHAYASLYQLPVTGLRFFTVYGPWGRPDMALFLFTKNILDNKPINVFNHGKMVRDFTYVDDIVSGIILALDNPAKPNLAWDGKAPDSASSYAPYRIYNIGNNKPEQLMHYIHAIENALGKKAIYNYLPMQMGDVPETHADIRLLNQDVGYLPSTSIETGVRNFVNWYGDYYKTV